jgi:hypothetical protein
MTLLPWEAGLDVEGGVLDDGEEVFEVFLVVGIERMTATSCAGYQDTEDLGSSAGTVSRLHAAPSATRSRPTANRHRDAIGDRHGRVVGRR